MKSCTWLYYGISKLNCINKITIKTNRVKKETWPFEKNFFEFRKYSQNISDSQNIGHQEQELYNRTIKGSACCLMYEVKYGRSIMIAIDYTPGDGLRDIMVITIAINWARDSSNTTHSLTCYNNMTYWSLIWDNIRYIIQTVYSVFSYTSNFAKSYSFLRLLKPSVHQNLCMHVLYILFDMSISWFLTHIPSKLYG